MLKDDNAAGSVTLDAEPGVARWQAIAAQLRADILAGRVGPGERLPNETTLAQRFGVNRHTLRQAVQALVREGHLDVRQGCGTFVRELVLDYALQRRTRLTENLARIGETAGRELLAHAVVPAGEWAEALKLPPRSRVVLLETRSSVRGRRVGLSTAAFPCPRLADIAAPVARHGSVTRALAELGVADYTRSRSVVSTRLPTQAEADALARPLSQPVLVVQYVNVDRAGVPVEAGSTLFAADAVQLVVEPEALA
ncbi:MAG: phosphonate metabolism transcriptional regulator PhnF [Burkholderiaceae bacterium]|jgi:GntR family phosphonate transport system transcriptional regulator